MRNGCQRRRIRKYCFPILVDTSVWVAVFFEEHEFLPDAFSIRASLSFTTLDADFRRFEPAGLALQLLTD